MNKTLLVLRNEVVTTVARRSFLLIVIGVPLLMMVLTLVIWFVKRPDAAPAVGEPRRPQSAQVEGYVDHSGIIKQLPPDVSADKLLPFDNEQAANQALEQGAIEAYYVIPGDYIASGKLFYVHPRASLTTSARTVWTVQWTLLVNMLDGDLDRAARIWNPLRLTATALAPDTARSRGAGEDLSMLPYLVVMVFYIVVIMAGSLLRNSLGEEHKNRVQEILLTSTRPMQLLLGKITALGIVGLLQMVIWASIGYLSLRIMGQTGFLPAGFRLPPSIIAWAALYFLLGYAVYGSLLGGLGALTGPNTPGSSTADIVVIWPTIIPLMLWGPIVDYPHSALAVALSLFPLTSPIAMLMRLIMGSVPAWQLALSIALLIATAYLVVRGVAATFRAQNLLTGQAFSLKGYVAMMLGRTAFHG